MLNIARTIIFAALASISIPALAASKPVLRGDVIGSTTGGTITLKFPSGTASGDLAVLFFSFGGTGSVPAGWTQLYQTPLESNDWNTIAAYCVLTAGQIAAGQVVIDVSGDFDLPAGLAVYKGSTVDGIRETEGFSYAGGGTLTNTTSSAVLDGDEALYWSTDREDGDPTLPVITPATGSATTLHTAKLTNSYSLFADQSMPGGVLSVETLFPNPGGGNGEDAVQVIVACKSSKGVC